MKVLVAGKGGVGKTTVSSLLSIIFARGGYKVIALDTDSVPNMAQNLGIPYEEAEKIVPLSMNEELTEERTGAKPGEGWGILFSLTPRVDDLPEKIGVRTPDGVLLIVVGGIQQPKEGCLCPSIALAKALLLHLLLSDKEIIIVDSEAGAEVFGRGLAEKFDVMLCVSEPTYKSLLIAKRLLEMGKGLGISKEYLVINKVRDEVQASQLYHKVFGGEIPYFFVRYDERVIKLENEGKGLNELPESSPAYSDVVRIYRKIRR